MVIQWTEAGASGVDGLCQRLAPVRVAEGFKRMQEQDTARTHPLNTKEKTAVDWVLSITISAVLLHVQVCKIMVLYLSL